MGSIRRKRPTKGYEIVDFLSIEPGNENNWFLVEPRAMDQSMPIRRNKESIEDGGDKPISSDPLHYRSLPYFLLGLVEAEPDALLLVFSAFVDSFLLMENQVSISILRHSTFEMER